MGISWPASRHRLACVSGLTARTTVAFGLMGRPDDKSNARASTTALTAATVALIVAAIVVGLAGNWIVAALPALGALVVGTLAVRSIGGTGSAPTVDAFAVGEPWRQYVQRSLRSERELARIVESTPAGPLRERLVAIAGRLGVGVQETWRIAQRGDALDDTIRRLDPVTLRGRLDHVTATTTTDGPPDADATAADAVRRQLESVERLQQQSARAASRLQLSQLRVEELVARAAEVSVGSADSESYAHDVDDLVIELEALRLAIDETDHL